MNNTEVKTKNIYQRLAEVRKSCAYLKKENEGYQFKYVSSSQTLGHLHNSINENGLILIPEIIKQDIQETTNQKGNKEFFTKLDMNTTDPTPTPSPTETPILGLQLVRGD